MTEDQQTEHEQNAAVQITTTQAAAAAEDGQEERKMSPEEFAAKKKQWQGKRVVEVQRVDAEGNVIQEDEDAKDAQQDADDVKEMAQPIKYTILGSADCPVDPEDERIDFAMSYRIPKIEGLEACTQLTVSNLCHLVANNISL